MSNPRVFQNADADVMKKTKEALPLWKVCLKYADSQELDEDIWIGMARQSLKEEKTKK